MTTPKYRITEKHFETHGIKRLERDGFSKSEIMSSMYKLTPGVSQTDRTKIVKELYNRRGGVLIMTDKKWIAGAIKHPGALREELHVKKGQKIPKKKLTAAAKKPGQEGKRARLAETLSKMKK